MDNESKVTQVQCLLQNKLHITWGFSCCSVTQACPTLCDPTDCSMPCPVPSPGLCSNSCLLSRLVMSSNQLILCHPLLLLPSIFPSIRVFSDESVLCIRWPEYWNFSFSISPSSEYSGLIPWIFHSLRMDWLDLLAVQGTLKRLLQHHNLKVPILQLSVFFMVQLSHPYMTTGKTIALTISTFIGKWCLCFLIHCLGFFQKASIF